MLFDKKKQTNKKTLILTEFLAILDDQEVLVVDPEEAKPALISENGKRPEENVYLVKVKVRTVSVTVHLSAHLKFCVSQGVVVSCWR